ncbi:hypothetical protein [Armatimonas sp.]|uniref:hypothetical protein n=1 Tax=Armatimonas sp. TaxID=1872638 RepID=UPI003753D01E
MQKYKAIEEITEGWCEDCFKKTNLTLIKMFIPLVSQFVDIDKQKQISMNFKPEADTLAKFSFIQCLLSWRQMSTNEWKSLGAKTGVSKEQIAHWANEAREDSINNKNVKPLFLVMAGYFHYKQFNYSKSLELCERALRLQPGLKSAHIICAESYSNKNISENNQTIKSTNAKKALEHLNSYTKISKDQNKKIMYVHIYTDLKNINKAIYYLDALINEGMQLNKPKDEIDRYIRWKRTLVSKASENKI